MSPGKPLLSQDPPGTVAKTGVAAERLAALGDQDPLSWARGVWDDRDAWLRSRGGVESVFMAAQLLGCREEAVRWLRCKTRL